MQQYSLTLQPISKFSGEINIPGSKSISNRALLLAAISYGTTNLYNLLNCDDVYYMLHAMKNLGIKIRLNKFNNSCEIIGNAGFFKKNYNKIKLFLGNAGTAMRPLIASMCIGEHDIILTGEERMTERPIYDLVNALRQGGANIEYLHKEGYPPVRIYGGFHGGKITLDSSISSQFLTSILMNAPLVENTTKIYIKNNISSKPYIDITLKLINSFGVEIYNDDYKFFYIQGGQKYISPGNHLIEGDASSASYFLAAAAIKGGTVRVKGIGINSIQGDIEFIDVLKKMGAKIKVGHDYIECTRSESLNGIDMDMNHIPDTAMTAAVIAIFANTPTTIRNIYNWRVKETDRLKAMSTELRKVGAIVDEGKDYIHIIPPLKLKTAQIETYNDHRMAMCFSLIALSNVPITIINPKCTAKTFPDYFDQFMKLTS